MFFDTCLEEPGTDQKKKDLLECYCATLYVVRPEYIYSFVFIDSLEL